MKRTRKISKKIGYEDTQWIGDGAAYYPLYGFPELDESTCFRFLNIPQDKEGKYQYAQGEFPEGFDLDDISENDKPVKRSETRIISGGRILLPLFVEDGILFLDEQYLSPFADEKNGYELYLRSSNGFKIIAVRVGFLLAGIVAPIELKEGGVSDLLMIAHMIGAKPEEDGAQVQIDEEEP